MEIYEIACVIDNLTGDDESEDYAEVRSDYYDEAKGATAIDTWKTADDNEEGHTVAYVYDDGNIEWIDPAAKNSKIVNEEIQNVINDSKNQDDKIELAKKKIEDACVFMQDVIDADDYELADSVIDLVDSYLESHLPDYER